MNYAWGVFARTKRETVKAASYSNKQIAMDLAKAFRSGTVNKGSKIYVRKVKI